MLCVLVSSGHHHSSYVDKYKRITLRWGYGCDKVAHPGLHHTVTLTTAMISLVSNQDKTIWDAIILCHLCLSSSAGSSNIRMNKHGKRERTSEGLTKNMQTVKDRKYKRLSCQLNMDINYIRFIWVEFMSKDYFRVIDDINDWYKKMLEIGNCVEVFRPADG